VLDAMRGYTFTGLDQDEFIGSFLELTDLLAKSSIFRVHLLRVSFPTYERMP
jgi:hypothetical protein